MPEAPKAFLFDIGNVLLKLKTEDLLSRVKAAHPAIDTDSFLAAIRHPDSPHALYERGKITGRDFYATLQAHWGLGWAYEDWLRQWNDYFSANPPMDVLLAKLAQKGGIRFFALSNTNAEHYAHVKQAYRLFDGFEEVIGSHQAGLRKPEPAFFSYALKRIGLRPEEVFFIDDIAAYVEVARSLGLRGFQYTFNDLELKAFLGAQGLELPVWENRPGNLGC